MSMKLRIILSSLLFVLTACAETTSETVSSLPKPESGAFASPDKPLSPIGIEHEIAGQPVPGVPLRIDLTITSNAAISMLTGEVRVEDALFLAPEAGSFSLADAGSGEPARHAITVTPLVEGLHRLTIVVQGMVAGQRQATTLSIPLRVGSVDTQRSPASLQKASRQNEF